MPTGIAQREGSKRMDQRGGRSAQEVFADHLREGKEGSVEVDLVRNYAEDVVILSGRGAAPARKLRDDATEAAGWLFRRPPCAGVCVRGVRRHLVTVNSSRMPMSSWLPTGQ